MIDDDAIFHLLVKRLVNVNYPDVEINEFLSGKKAITELQNTSEKYPEIIIFDLNMPEYSGWDFLEDYKKLDIPTEVTKLYIVTSSVDQYDIDRAKKYPFVVDFISKPIVLDTLQRIVTI